MTISKLRSRVTRPLALAILVALSVPAWARDTDSLGLVAHATPLRQGDAFTSALPSTQPMHLVVALKMRNQAQLDQRIGAHQTLTSAQILTDHAPTRQQAQAVADYLTRAGFKNVVIAANRLLVSADGSAGSAGTAFHASFARVKTREGRVAFANTSAAQIPAALASSVLSVIGLQNVYQAHSNARRALPVAGTVTPGLNGHNPTEFAAIYSATNLPTAAGVSVGIITVGDMTQVVTDLNAFTDANGLRRVTTQTVESNPSRPGSGNADLGEWDLDSQTIVGAAGGKVGKLIFYNEPGWSWADLVTNFNKVVSDNQAKIINASLGGCEIGVPAAALDQVFKIGAVQGQTFSISTGDFGGDGCLDGIRGTDPQWPAASQYVVAVSGTTLNTSTTTWNGEVVWNDPRANYWGTGGSYSKFEPQPSWQNGLAIGNKRGAADIAFDADPLTGSRIIVNGGIQQWGGTSLSAPIFAGLWARVIAVRGTGIGFAAPLLYQLPTTDFHDVTVGNDYSVDGNPQTGFPAKVGWDVVSGRGSMIMATAISHLGVTNPIVANFNVTATGLIAKFTDTSSGGTIVTHAWSFGDGGTSKLGNPSHVYSRAGTYRVSETVTDRLNWTATKTMSISIGN
jgi:xanthomonalisin